MVGDIRNHSSRGSRAKPHLYWLVHPRIPRFIEMVAKPVQASMCETVPHLRLLNLHPPQFLGGIMPLGGLPLTGANPQPVYTSTYQGLTVTARRAEPWAQHSTPASPKATHRRP